MAGSYVSPTGISNPEQGNPILPTWGDAVNAALDYFDTLIDDAAWISYTPVINQGASLNIAKTILYSKYKKIGKTVFFMINLNITAAGSAASLTITLPPIASVATVGAIGSSWYFDASPTSLYAMTVGLASSTTSMWFVASAPASGAVFSLAVANGDNVTAMGTYEGAT